MGHVCMWVGVLAGAVGCWAWELWGRWVPWRGGSLHGVSVPGWVAVWNQSWVVDVETDAIHVGPDVADRLVWGTDEAVLVVSTSVEREQSERVGVVAVPPGSVVCCIVGYKCN